MASGRGLDFGIVDCMINESGGLVLLVLITVQEYETLLQMGVPVVLYLIIRSSLKMRGYSSPPEFFFFSIKRKKISIGS